MLKRFCKLVVTGMVALVAMGVASAKVISDGPYGVGDQISYEFTVTNSGNVTLTGLELSDPLLGDGLACPTGELEPGAGVVCGPFHYTVTEDDVSAGEVQSHARARAVVKAGTNPGAKTAQVVEHTLASNTKVGNARLAPAIAAVPALGQWALIVLGLMAAGFGAWRLPRRAI